MPWAEGKGPEYQPRKYGGKEFIEMHGYDMYDSFARMMDPLTGRTPTPDPHCENYYSISPYAWCGNNFVNRIDPNGLDNIPFDSVRGNFDNFDTANDAILLGDVIIKPRKRDDSWAWTTEDSQWTFNGTYEHYVIAYPRWCRLVVCTLIL